MEAVSEEGIRSVVVGSVVTGLSVLAGAARVAYGVAVLLVAFGFRVSGLAAVAARGPVGPVAVVGALAGVAGALTRVGCDEGRLGLGCSTEAGRGQVPQAPLLRRRMEDTLSKVTSSMGRRLNAAAIWLYVSGKER